MKLLIPALLALLLPACLPAQNGVPDPARVAGQPVGDTLLARILTSVEIEGQAVTRSGMGVRVLTVGGGDARLDCDCLLTGVFIVADTEEESGVFDLGELLDPEISLDASGAVPVVLITYGLPSAPRKVRLEARPGGLRLLPPA